MIIFILSAIGLFAVISFAAYTGYTHGYKAARKRDRYRDSYPQSVVKSMSKLDKD